MGELERKLAELKQKQVTMEELKSLVGETVQAVTKNQNDNVKMMSVLEDWIKRSKSDLDTATEGIYEDMAKGFDMVTEKVKESINAQQEINKDLAQNITATAEALKTSLESVKLDVEVNHPDVKVPPADVKVIEKESINDKYMGADFDTKNKNLEYHGYLAKDGSWYIEKIAHDKSGRTHRFKTGKKGYKSAWLDKARGNYKHLSEVEI